MSKKVAVVLFNLGGPDGPEAVEPFLFNLFYDPAIMEVPNPIRWLLAKLISAKRAPVAREIYAHIGGSSPLLSLTRNQADALAVRISETCDFDVKVTVAMRYWRPFAEDAVNEVAIYDPDEIVLLPLYPQFSSTTSGSSLKNWKLFADRAGLRKPTKTICCYPRQPGWVRAQSDLVKKTLSKVPKDQKNRVLFSAHGLPRKVVNAGDPYRWQVEQTVEAVVEEMDIDGLDHVICYQSRVGPLEWIGPSTEDELSRAAKDGVAVIVTPVAFVSEHSETLVELDIEYRKTAEEIGIAGYYRVPAVGVHTDFISGLAEMVREAISGDASLSNGHESTAICPETCGRCPQANGRGRQDHGSR